MYCTCATWPWFGHLFADYQIMYSTGNCQLSIFNFPLSIFDFPSSSFDPSIINLRFSIIDLRSFIIFCTTDLPIVDYGTGTLSESADAVDTPTPRSGLTTPFVKYLRATLACPVSRACWHSTLSLKRFDLRKLVVFWSDCFCVGSVSNGLGRYARLLRLLYVVCISGRSTDRRPTSIRNCLFRCSWSDPLLKNGTRTV